MSFFHPGQRGDTFPLVSTSNPKSNLCPQTEKQSMRVSSLLASRQNPVGMRP